MAFADFMSKVRYWDNRSAKWIMRHFYILFFEILLVAVFVFLFINVIQIINLNADVSRGSILERLLLAESVNTLIIVFLMLLNSFWLLYMFSSILRMKAILKDVSFNLIKRNRSSN